MTKTLADMTAEERAECVGMWTDATHCALQGIIMGVFLDHARVLIPENAAEYSDEEEYIWVLNHVAPRFDLPRAWTPDGQPVEMVKEYGIFYTLRDGGEEVCFVHDDPLSVEPAVKHLEKSLRRGTITKITRKTQWVTEWEEVPEPQRTNGMVNPYV